MEVTTKRKELTLAGDWNERPGKEGTYTPHWVAQQLKLSCHWDGGHSVLGPIDFLMSSTSCNDVRTIQGGASDHVARIFKQHVNGVNYLLLHWNVERDRHGSRLSELHDFLKHLMETYDLDVLLLQETQQYHDNFRVWFGADYEIYHGQGPKGNQTVMVSKRHKSGEFKNRRMSSWWRVRHNRHQPVYTPFVVVDSYFMVASIHETVGVDWKNGKPHGPKDRIRARVQSAKFLVKYGKQWLK